ncbi:hypothetical protein QT381_02685 [Galbitalea sp. SE-J8]|nr:hypothetical protein [Galbitalea sp. SE-J8]
MYSQTWPTSGTTRHGMASPLPTPGRRTSDSASSSSPGPLLPTPIGSDARGGQKDIARSEFSPQFREIAQLLPTPSASNPNDGEDVENWKARRERVKATGVNGNGFGTPLAIAVRLLKTPTAQLAANGGSQHPEKRKEGGHGPTLADEIEHLRPTPPTRNGQGNPTLGGALEAVVARSSGVSSVPLFDVGDES